MHDVPNLTDSFKEAEGTLESKYELYKTMCKEVGVLFALALKQQRLPRCHDNDVSHKEDHDKPLFLEEHFEFVCNFNQAEYEGYLHMFVKLTGMDRRNECFKLIETHFATDSEKSLPDFCR